MDVYKCVNCEREFLADMPITHDCPKGLIWNLHIFDENPVKVEIPDSLASLDA